MISLSEMVNIKMCRVTSDTPNDYGVAGVNRLRDDRKITNFQCLNGDDTMVETHTVSISAFFNN